MRHNARLRPSCLARGTSSRNRSSSENVPDTMYLDCLFPGGLLTMSICGKFYSLPERRVSRFSEVATSTVHLWPCTLITNPTLCKHQAACSGRPFRNGLRFSAVCALPHQPRLSSTVCVRASLPSNTSLILSVLQTWLDQTLMAPCSSIYLGLCVSYP